MSLTYSDGGCALSSRANFLIGRRGLELRPKSQRLRSRFGPKYSVIYARSKNLSCTAIEDGVGAEKEVSISEKRSVTDDQPDPSGRDQLTATFVELAIRLGALGFIL